MTRKVTASLYMTLDGRGEFQNHEHGVERGYIAVEI
jgi:hypothetical protein